MWNNNNQWRTDRFGRPSKPIAIKPSKKNGFPKGFVELNGQLYEVTTSPAKNPKNPEVIGWVTLTKLQRRR